MKKCSKCIHPFDAPTYTPIIIRITMAPILVMVNMFCTKDANEIPLKLTKVKVAIKIAAKICWLVI